jgi:hypothetical protein
MDMRKLILLEDKISALEEKLATQQFKTQTVLTPTSLKNGGSTSQQ